MTEQTTTLAEGDLAPDFTLPVNGGGELSLRDLSGSPSIVYFYPKDNTPGCTTEALDFTHLAEEFAKLEARIIGYLTGQRQKA